MTIEHPLDNLYLIPLDLPREGFRHFISTWIHTPAGKVILIDPGPRTTIPALFTALEELHIDRLDLVLVTHIHLDHAGGLGELLKRYPETKVICHPRGIPHLVDPAKLWEASRKVLGDIADLYGELVPVPRGNIAFQREVAIGEITVTAIETPGHAPHHLCYRIGDVLFAGEAVGINYPLERSLYLRIASPPGFNLEEHKKTVALLSRIEAQVFCHGHYGLSTEIGPIFALAAAQAEIWAEIIAKYSRLESPRFEETVLAALLAVDPGLSAFSQLPEDIRRRETVFFTNSFLGFRMALSKR